MLERFFKDLTAVQQHRNAVIVGPYLDGVVEYLAGVGYSPADSSSIHLRLRGVRSVSR